MLKKLIASAFILSIIALGHVSDANADGSTPPKVSVSPAVLNQQVAKLLMTRIQGDIAVPSTFGQSGYGSASSLANFQCSNLVIIATSKDQKPKPPNVDFWDSPVWTRSVQATGNWSSGHCSYSMVVPGDSQFKLSPGDIGSFNCAPIIIGMTNTPAWQSVPKGTAKVDNLTITNVTCNIVG